MTSEARTPVGCSVGSPSRQSRESTSRPEWKNAPDSAFDTGTPMGITQSRDSAPLGETTLCPSMESDSSEPRKDSSRPSGVTGVGAWSGQLPLRLSLTPQSRESRESRESRVEALGLARVGEWAKSKGPSSILGAEISGSIYGGVAVLPVEPLSGSLASKVNSAGVCESLPAGLTPSSCTATLAVGIELLNLGVVQGRDCGGSCPVRGSDNDPFWHLKRRWPAHCRAAP